MKMTPEQAAAFKAARDEADFDHSAVKIYWPNGEPSAEIMAKVREDIATDSDLRQLEEPSDLMYHHIALERGNYSGPSVILTGNKENGGFSAEYFEVMEAMSFSMDVLSPDVQKLLQEMVRKIKDDEE